MLLFLDLSTIFVASVHVVQVGEEIVNRIAMEKFGFSLEKYGSLKDYFKLINYIISRVVQLTSSMLYSSKRVFCGTILHKVTHKEQIKQPN